MRSQRGGEESFSASGIEQQQQASRRNSRYRTGQQPYHYERHSGAATNLDLYHGGATSLYPSQQEQQEYQPGSMDQQFAEFLQQEANNPAFAAYHYHQDTDDEEQQQPKIDDIIETDDEQTVVSEITTFTSASLFRGPLYQRPTAVLDDSLNDEEIADLFTSNNTTTVGGNTRSTTTTTTTTTAGAAAKATASDTEKEEPGEETTRENGNDWSGGTGNPRLHQSTDNVTQLKDSNLNWHLPQQPQQQQQQQQQQQHLAGYRTPTETTSNKGGKRNLSKGNLEGGYSLHRLKGIIEEDDNGEILEVGGKRKKEQQPLSVIHSDLQSCDDDGTILKTATATVHQQPGAYSATNSGTNQQEYSEAMQIPDYRNALGLSITTTTNNTTPVHNDDANDNDNVDNNNNESATATAKDEINKERWYKKNRRRLVIAGVVVLLIVIGIISIVISLVFPQDNNFEAELDSSRGEKEEQKQQPETEQYIVPNLTQATIQSIEGDKFSPQFLAYDWVSRDPNLDTYEGWRKQQRFALMCIYFAIVFPVMRDPPYPIEPSYYSNECSWIRVVTNTPYCNDRGEFVLFVMRAAGNVPNSAQLPPQIGYLSKLKIFKFDNVPLDRTLDEFLPPPTLERFPPSIQEISFRAAKLKGSIPSTLGLLTSLTSLDFRTTAAHVGHVSYLESFINELTSNIPTELGLLSSLRHLYLSGNLLSGSIPKELGRQQLPSLVNFQIEGNPDLDPPLPDTFCDGLGVDDNNHSVAPFESLLTDWCDNQLDCCGGTS